MVTNADKKLFTIFDQAIRETEGVKERIGVELAKVPELEFLTGQMLSYLYYAADKLIERKVRTGELRSRDEALIFSIPRLFNECFSGYLLARSGLVLQAIILLRSAFETTSQSILFMEDETMATKWLAGERIRPSTVRAKSKFAAAHKDLYARLSGLAHPNLEALGQYSVPLMDKGITAQMYGGCFMPKAAGQISAQFLYAPLVFLEVFYATYEADLGEHGLLWRSGASKESQGKMTWSVFLGGLRAMAEKATSAFNDQDSDAAGLEDHISSLAEASSRKTDSKPGA